jgi:hypothetical protein
MTKLAQDREMAIREALQSITQANCGELTPQQLLALYIECEAVQSKQQLDAAYINIARHAFKDVEIHLGCHIDEGTLDKSIKCLLQPHLHPDAVPVITSLHACGYKILDFSSVDATTFSQCFQPPMPAEITVIHPSPTCAPLYSPNTQLFPDLLAYCRSSDEALQPDQILVVTAAPYRIVESANKAGFPTSLIKRAQDLESNVNIDTAVPTLVISEMSLLCEAVERFPLNPQDPGISHRIQQFRVNGLYQATKLVGYGSFGEVDLYITICCVNVHQV